MRVKEFVESEDVLDNAVNHFLLQNIKVIDIKYSLAVDSEDDKIVSGCLVLYEEE